MVPYIQKIPPENANFICSASLKRSDDFGFRIINLSSKLYYIYSSNPSNTNALIKSIHHVILFSSPYSHSSPSLTTVDGSEVVPIPVESLTDDMGGIAYPLAFISYTNHPFRFAISPTLKHNAPQTTAPKVKRYTYQLLIKMIAIVARHGGTATNTAAQSGRGIRQGRSTLVERERKREQKFQVCQIRSKQMAVQQQ